MRKYKPFTFRNAIIENSFCNYKKSTNMGFKELLKWARNPVSRKGSICRRIIRQNLELLRTPKHRWNMKHVRWAKKYCGLIKKTRNMKSGRLVDGCGFSKKTINLKNMGFNPNKR